MMTPNLVTKNVPLSNINANTGFNIRQVYTGIEDVGKPDEDGYQEGLATAIKRDGLMNPLTVRPSSKKPGTYDLVAGFRRYKALKHNGAETADVRILENLSDVAARYANAKENLDREGLTTYELAAWASKTVDDYKQTQADVATALGKSRSYITNLIANYKSLAPEILSEWQHQHPMAKTDYLNTIRGLDHAAQLERWAAHVGVNADDADDDGEDDGEEGSGLESENKPAKVKRATVRQLDEALAAARKLMKKNKSDKSLAMAVQCLEFAKGNRKSITGVFEPRKPTEE